MKKRVFNHLFLILYPILPLILLPIYDYHLSLLLKRYPGDTIWIFFGHLYSLLSYLCLVCLPLFRQERAVPLLSRYDWIIGKCLFSSLLILYPVAFQPIKAVFQHVF